MLVSKEARQQTPPPTNPSSCCVSSPPPLAISSQNKGRWWQRRVSVCPICPLTLFTVSWTNHVTVRSGWNSFWSSIYNVAYWIWRGRGHSTFICKCLRSQSCRSVTPILQETLGNLRSTFQNFGKIVLSRRHHFNFHCSVLTNCVDLPGRRPWLAW